MCQLTNLTGTEISRRKLRRIALPLHQLMMKLPTKVMKNFSISTLLSRMIRSRIDKINWSKTCSKFQTIKSYLKTGPKFLPTNNGKSGKQELMRYRLPINQLKDYWAVILMFHNISYHDPLHHKSSLLKDYLHHISLIDSWCYPTSLKNDKLEILFRTRERKSVME